MFSFRFWEDVPPMNKVNGTLTQESHSVCPSVVILEWGLTARPFGKRKAQTSQLFKPTEQEPAWSQEKSLFFWLFSSWSHQVKCVQHTGNWRSYDVEMGSLTTKSSVHCQHSCLGRWHPDWGLRKQSEATFGPDWSFGSIPRALVASEVPSNVTSDACVQGKYAGGANLPGCTVHAPLGCLQEFCKISTFDHQQNMEGGFWCHFTWSGNE